MLKLTKVSWLILCVGIFAITFISLGAAQSQQLLARKQLTEELASANLRLSKLDPKELTAKEESLKAQIEQANAKIAEVKTKLFQPNDSITVTDSLFRIAQASNVEVREIGSSGLGNGKLDKVDASRLPLTVLVKGEVPNLIAFIINVHSNFPTGMVKTAQIVIPSGFADAIPFGDNTTAVVRESLIITTDNIIVQVSENSTGPGAKMPTAGIQLEVFSYQGS